MSNCEYCDYYKLLGDTNAAKGTIKAVCLFADVTLFNHSSETVEYPCKHISYQEYIGRETSRVGISKVTNENWKLIYKSRHPSAERIRSKSSKTAIL
jgi:hypothetical protein